MKISCYTEALIQDERFSRIGLRVQGLSSLGLRNFRSLTRLRARNEREIEDVACLVLYVSEAAHTIIQNHVTRSLNYSTWHIDEVCRAASSCPLTKNMCSTTTSARKPRLCRDSQQTNCAPICQHQARSLRCSDPPPSLAP